MNTIAWLKKFIRLLPACFTLVLAAVPQSDADSGISGGSFNPPLTPIANGSLGQQAVYRAISAACFTANPLGALCGSGNSSDLAAQQLSPQASMQADSIAISSPYDFVKKINNRIQRINDCDDTNKSAKSREDCEKKVTVAETAVTSARSAFRSAAAAASATATTPAAKPASTLIPNTRTPFWITGSTSNLPAACLWAICTPTGT